MPFSHFLLRPRDARQSTAGPSGSPDAGGCGAGAAAGGAGVTARTAQDPQIRSRRRRSRLLRGIRVVLAAVDARLVGPRGRGRRPWLRRRRCGGPRLHACWMSVWIFGRHRKTYRCGLLARCNTLSACRKVSLALWPSQRWQNISRTCCPSGPATCDPLDEGEREQSRPALPFSSDVSRGNGTGLIPV
jgi:hypothetical protein